MGARCLATNSLCGSAAQRWQQVHACAPRPPSLQLSCAALSLTSRHVLVWYVSAAPARHASPELRSTPTLPAPCCLPDLAMRRAREATQQAERNARHASWKEARESGALFRTTYGKSEDAMVRDLPACTPTLGKTCAHVLLAATCHYRYNLAGPGEESRQTLACLRAMRQCDQTRQQLRRQRTPPQPMHPPGRHATKSSALHMLEVLGTSSMCPLKRLASE